MEIVRDRRDMRAHGRPVIGKDIYRASLSDDGLSIVLERNNIKRKVPVIDDSEFIFKVMATKIKAKGGAAGLLAFFEKCKKENFGTSYFFAIVDRYADRYIDV